MHRVQLRHHRVEDLLVLHLDEVELLPVLAVAAALDASVDQVGAAQDHEVVVEEAQLQGLCVIE